MNLENLTRWMAIFGVGFVILVLTFLVDSFICLQGAQSMEKKIEECQRQRNASQGREAKSPISGSDSEETEFNYVEVSKIVDTSFGCASDTPNSTFVVCRLSSARPLF